MAGTQWSPQGAPVCLMELLCIYTSAKIRIRPLEAGPNMLGQMFFLSFSGVNMEKLQCKESKRDPIWFKFCLRTNNSNHACAVSWGMAWWQVLYLASTWNTFLQNTTKNGVSNRSLKPRSLQVSQGRLLSNTAICPFRVVVATGACAHAFTWIQWSFLCLKTSSV